MTANVPTASQPDQPDHVRLDVDQADELAFLLAKLEDWLLHASEDARSDLADFLHGPHNGALAAAGLIDHIGTHAAALSRSLKEVTQP
jgi:hypothetical protein